MRNRLRLVATGLVVAGLVVSSCAANPGPPPAVEPEPAPTTTTTTSTTSSTSAAPDQERSEIAVGVEALRNGLNPHVLADESSVVLSIANLVLPSAFVSGQLNVDILDEAVVEPESPAAMTVRYQINDAAQWSDGTPLTGADFNYLWQQMSTTPGVVDPAGYRAIQDVRVSGAEGKTVHVDFSEPVAYWQELFRHLLPSHLLRLDTNSFHRGMRDGIPASAGRYMVEEVDRGRKVITLHRNDRFWGTDPASVDQLTLVAVRSTTHSADQLRSGQIQFVDSVPAETSADTYRLIPQTQQRMIDTPRTLGISLSTTSPVLADQQVRAELRSLIDVPLLARIAAGRSSDLQVADHEAVSEAEPILVRAAVEENRPLRLVADPADSAASAAARSLVDMLNQRGVRAEVVATDLRDATTNRLPDGDVDGVIMWDHEDLTANDAASELLCPSGLYRAGNLSGYCTPETDQFSRDVLAGRIDPATAQEYVDAVNRREAIWVPLLHETRLLVLGPGVVGPDPDLTQWEAGLSTAETWRLPNTLGGITSPGEPSGLPPDTLTEDDTEHDTEHDTEDN
ncbi:ABC transporter family substrate-binding protein [Corynebacterium cystitidis]|uniref:ABC transporter family substrate-binding protein n=1 Tax=Corynebacterium cystitidis TaxID=35757 RepID=UPI00211DB0BC|nr:ABC transporter family substrate-binding protein [Corynebacterium cystitidis]